MNPYTSVDLSGMGSDELYRALIEVNDAIIARLEAGEGTPPDLAAWERALGWEAQRRQDAAQPPDDDLPY